MSKKCFIFGAGDFGFTLARMLPFHVDGFLVDEAYYKDSLYQGIPVFPLNETLQREIMTYDHAVYFAIGYNNMQAREQAFVRLVNSGIHPSTFISKQAFIDSTAELGFGNIIFPGVVLEAGVVLGNNNIIWSNVTVCHDTQLEDHNFIASGSTIGGFASIHNRCFLGFGSVVDSYVEVLNDTLLGANSFLTHCASSGSLYVGNPAAQKKAARSSSSSISSGFNQSLPSLPTEVPP